MRLSFSPARGRMDVEVEQEEEKVPSSGGGVPGGLTAAEF